MARTLLARLSRGHVPRHPSRWVKYNPIFAESQGQYRTNEQVRWRMIFPSDAMAGSEGLPDDKSKKPQAAEAENQSGRARPAHSILWLLIVL